LAYICFLFFFVHWPAFVNFLVYSGWSRFEIRLMHRWGQLVQDRNILDRSFCSLYFFSCTGQLFAIFFSLGRGGGGLFGTVADVT
jgi:hypothetical protein